MTDTPPAWADRRVLVTGCTGFLGSVAVRRLAERGAAVVGLVRDRVSTADLTTAGLTSRVRVAHGRLDDRRRLSTLLAVHDVRAVLHLAAEPPVDGRDTADPGTAALLEAVWRFDRVVPVVIARPAAAAAYVTAPAGWPGLPFGVARFGEVYGGGDRKVFKVVPATALSLLSGERPVTPSDAGPGRDFVHVSDAAGGCVRLLEHLLATPTPGVTEHDFRSGSTLTDRDAVAAVKDAFAGRPPTAAGSRPAEPNAVGWSPALSLADGLAETIGWYRDFSRASFFGTRTTAAARRSAA